MKPSHSREAYVDQIAETIKTCGLYNFSLASFSTAAQLKFALLSENLSYVNQIAETVEIKERNEKMHDHYFLSRTLPRVKIYILVKYFSSSMVS